MPPTRSFILPEPFAWFANLLGIAYVIVTTVLFLFPPDLPVTGNNMNYCVVAFFIVLVISVIQWFVDGRKNYTGPKMDIDVRTLTAVQSPEMARIDAARVNGAGSGSDVNGDAKDVYN